MTDTYSLAVKIPSTGLNVGLEKLCNRPQSIVVLQCQNTEKYMQLVVVMNEFTIMKKIIWLGGNEDVTDTTQPGTEVKLWMNAHVTSEKYGQL